MDKVKRFMELKELWKKASETERAEIDKELVGLLDSMDENETPALEEAVTDDFKRMHEEVSDIERTIAIRKTLEPILPMINVSAFTRMYFGKSSSWFYQRLNGNIVHGKPAAFTKEELNKLQESLQAYAKLILSVQID